jgi:hypothetical protein
MITRTGEGLNTEQSHQDETMFEQLYHFQQNGIPINST